MTILAWVAEAAPVLESANQPIIGLDHPVIAAAAEWLEASLSLSEEPAYLPAGSGGLQPAADMR